MRSQRAQRGFTLPELLVVIVVFVTVGVVGLFLIRPVDYSAKRRDAERWAGAAHIIHALNKYEAEHGKLPAGITADSGLIGTDSDTLNLCELVPAYTKALPVDPLANTGADATCQDLQEGNPLLTGYAVHTVSEDTVEVVAPLAEGDEKITLRKKY